MNDSQPERVPPPRAHLSMESRSYYAGLPSCPVLVGRSSTFPWEMPPGPEAYFRRKMLGAVGRHYIKEIWEDHLHLEIVAHLDSKEVAWTSIDVVRISYVDDSFRPVIVWIGVQPESLSAEDGTKVACSSQEILRQSDILDVDVEIRESLVILLKGPKLLAPTDSLDPLVDIQNPLTPTLGVPISGKLTPWAEGTGGFFIAEGGGSNRLFLVTARHVVLKPDRDDNKTYEYSSPIAPRREINLFGDAGLKKYLEYIKFEIDGKEMIIKNLKWHVAKAEGVAGDAAEEKHKEAVYELAKAEKALKAISIFYQDVSKHWNRPDQRVLGHVIYSPPIELSFGPEKYTQDFAVIDIDRSKIDATNFKGNFIGLGTQIPPITFTRMMYPNLQNAHSFDYPEGRLLKLKGTISDKDMRHPPDLDRHDEPCLMVVKHGLATGLTVGRANDIRSVVRTYHDIGITGFSLEWAILALDDKSGPFSASGDSGAVVADGKGRIGGIITGGTSWSDRVDVTYATSINHIMQGIKEKFPKAHLNPDLGI